MNKNNIHSLREHKNAFHHNIRIEKWKENFIMLFI